MQQIKGAKRLALTRDGRMTWCTSPEEKIGWGRCNHIAHAHAGETSESFGIRAEALLDALESNNAPALNVTTMNGNISSPSGMQAKWYDEKEDIWYKLDRNGSYDGLAECLVSDLLDHTDIQHAKYSMTWMKTAHGELQTGCESKNFLKLGEELITWNELVQNPGELYHDKSMKQQFDALLQTVTNHFNMNDEQVRNVRSYMLKTLALDYITLNTDRHLGNLAFVIKVDAKSGIEYVKPAPLFDHGGALGVNWNAHMYHHGMSISEVEGKSPLATFTSDEPEDYLDLVHECLEEDASLDDMLVISDADGLFKYLEEYEAEQYGTDIPKRSAQLLLRRLKNSECYAWIRKGGS